MEDAHHTQGNMHDGIKKGVTQIGHISEYGTCKFL